MFERYSETARKAVFMARYEASQFGSEYIETEHLLLGILRADAPLARRLWAAPGKIASIRDQIEKQLPRREKTSTSVDIPVSKDGKRVLKYAAEEADRLSDRAIRPDHLLMGMLRLEQSPGAKILAEHGVTTEVLERHHDSRPEPEATNPTAEHALAGALMPLIGRDSEVERIIGILSRRTRNNPVLIGEPGVGKNTIVNGLAQRITDAAVPVALTERVLVEVEARLLLRSGKLPDDADRPNAILYVPGLFDLARKVDGWGALEAIHALEPRLARGQQCIATGTPLGLRMTVERAEMPARHFEVVPVLPPDEEEAIRIVIGVKNQYERFHGVSISNEAIETAVIASRWFLRHRELPDRAIDLIDDAGARVKLRGEWEPNEVIEIRTRLRRIIRQMENAIATHEFNQARIYSDEERRERENLRQLQEKLGRNPQGNIVTSQDVVEAVAARSGATVAAVTSLLQAKDVAAAEEIARDLARQVSTGGREWVDGLVGYLAGCSGEEAESLAEAIRAAKGKLDRS